MPTALPLQNNISQSSNTKVSFRTIESQFGNGFSQRTPDGINNRIEEWSIIWENIRSSERDTILTALDSVGSWDYLTWGTKKYIVTQDGYTITEKSGDIYDVSVALKQVFDV
jgi:phage-related protein